MTVTVPIKLLMMLHLYIKVTSHFEKVKKKSKTKSPCHYSNDQLIAQLNISYAWRLNFNLKSTESLTVSSTKTVKSHSLHLDREIKKKTARKHNLNGPNHDFAASSLEQLTSLRFNTCANCNSFGRKKHVRWTRLSCIE